MATPHQPYESLRERARRVLMDNPPPPPRPIPEPTGEAEADPAAVAPRVMMEQGPALPIGATPLPVLSADSPATSVPAQPGSPAVQPTQPVQQQPIQQPIQQQPILPLPVQRAPQMVPEPESSNGDDLLQLVQERLKAIRTMQDLLPKQVCSSQRVRELSQSLANTSGDSVYYRATLDRLREAHEEWLDLEEQLWAADHVVRSTQWLVELLSEPSRRSGSTRSKSASSQ